ncbi:AI-2E family transporter [Variovorax sp. PAMC 28711]|uniref:AI-2E family transporter n=1 Tax=Variovorax sp. PAMC 28711 TaxID=1795631 RepID=UPI00078E7E27|nr:AI-2E family transporter [Variovorax sp. PAMC 28711]AMM26012.1 transporter [Variovorax sp. PAMC 28711]
MNVPTVDTRIVLGRIVPLTCALALLHFGQDFLKPIAVAAILSLVITPLARKLAASGLGRTVSTLVSVLLVGAVVVWISAVLAIQLVAVAADLPQYKAAIATKVESIRASTLRPFEQIEAELKGVLPQGPSTARSADRQLPAAEAVETLMAVQIHQVPQSAGDMVSKLVSALWGPLGEAGIVFVLLVFILMERESLSDRVIRLVGEAELGVTVQTLTEAAEGVSKFFLSQALVNTTFGLVVALGMWALGVPHAALWGVVSALLRFIPYVGVFGAAALIGVFSAAVDPGWSLVIWSLGLFLALELLVAHVVEPQVYGHSTGLAPLAVIVSALFWGAMWGPVGLLLSTPLTLCLVVIGRHVRALEPLTILLSEAPGLTAGQRFYQRALSGNSEAILRDARLYLRRGSFAKYCDHVLLPGLALSAADFSVGRIDGPQRERVQANIVRLAESLSATQPERRASRRRPPVSLVDANIGAHLRKMREARMGKWQGRLDVPSRSIVLCLGFGTERDELLMELTVRALRENGVDARSVSLDDPQDPAAADKSILVGTAFLVYPQQEAIDQWCAIATELRAALPQAILATIKLRLFRDDVGDEERVKQHVDLVVRSYAEAEAFVLQGNAPDGQPGAAIAAAG